MDQGDEFFVNVLHPWLELNKLLSQPFAFDPQLSLVARQTHMIATAIKHQVDLDAHERYIRMRLEQPPVKGVQKEVDAESVAARVMSDVADRSKHVSLRDPARMSTTSVCAGFEVVDAQFRFIRNIVLITHSSLGEFDFMETSLEAIRYWIKRRSIPLNAELQISEADPVFLQDAILYHDQNYCHRIEQLQLRTFQRNEEGELVRFEPPYFSFSLRDPPSRV